MKRGVGAYSRLMGPWEPELSRVGFQMELKWAPYWRIGADSAG